MIDYRGIEAQLRDGFDLRRRPVAMTFRDAVPPGVARFTGTEPSGCSFWRVAAGRRTVALAHQHRGRRQALSTE